MTRPGRTTTTAPSHCKLQSTVDSPWDPHPPAPNSWEQTWQRVCPNWSGSPEETWEKVLVSPFPQFACFLRAHQKPGGPARLHTSADHAIPQVPVLLETSPTSRASHCMPIASTGVRAPQDPGNSALEAGPTAIQ